MTLRVSSLKFLCRLSISNQLSVIICTEFMLRKQFYVRSYPIDFISKYSNVILKKRLKTYAPEYMKLWRLFLEIIRYFPYNV